MNGMPKAMVLTGYGLNCDYETDYCLRMAGAESERVHINDLISHEGQPARRNLEDYHMVVFDGGFSWGDDHGAGVLLASRMKVHLGEQIKKFVDDGKLILAICNGFQAVVNLGLLPGFDNDYTRREVALITNDCGNFRNDWVGLAVNPDSPCVFTPGIEFLEVPIRHGEGKFYASEHVLRRLAEQNQIVFRYGGPDGKPAQGAFPYNPNGSLMDIAGICDPTGRVLGLMPHPEAHNHATNHPLWTRNRGSGANEEGQGMKIFRNAVSFIRQTLLT